MLGSSIPIAGIIVALFAAAASVSATALTASALAEDYDPLHLGLLYLPEAGGAVITAVVLGLILDTRYLHHLPLVGMGFLAAGIAVGASGSSSVLPGSAPSCRRARWGQTLQGC